MKTSMLLLVTNAIIEEMTVIENDLYERGE
jgi:hypothetical protein